jgi:hypothetical protein
MSPTNELVGSHLGRYQISQHLATGGMAEIYLAHLDGMSRFRKELVLKVLQTRWEGHPEVVDLFLGEARLSALMDHPNIVDVYDVAEQSERHFIAMEHIAGKTLAELAKRAIAVTRSIPVEVGVFIAAEIAGALAYMYDGLGSRSEPLRVIHRDISPTNILISNLGQVKLIDFGIARQGPTVIEESGARPGKVTYMSPEQVKGAPLDGRSDIFCLGTILYEITLGRRLWRGPRDVASKRIVEERPKPPTFVRQEYPPELEMIVLRTLEKRPEDRYQSASELYSDLQGFLSQSGAHLRNNCQMADYVSKIFSDEADALISDAGRERAQAFVDGGAAAEPDRDELDFDLAQADGPGAALAKAMRSSALGVWADVDNPKTRAGSSDAGAEDDEPLFSAGKGELERGRVSRPVGTSSGGAAGHTEPSEKKAEDVASAHAMGKVNPGHSWMTQPPASSRRTIFIGLALFLAAMVGLFLWLRTG